MGVGKIGRAQIAAVRSIDFADVAAIAMRDPERAAAMASELKISTHCRDYRDLVADPDETSPLNFTQLEGKSAAAAAKRLQAVLDRFQDARPAELDRRFEQTTKSPLP